MTNRKNGIGKYIKVTVSLLTVMSLMFAVTGCSKDENNTTFPTKSVGVEDTTKIIQVSAGKSHTVGLRADGTVVAVEDNEYGQCDIDDWNK